MNRMWLIPVAAVALAGAASLAQAAPASSMLGTIKVEHSELAGKAQEVKWRWWHHRRHHHHHRHHRHRHHRWW